LTVQQESGHLSSIRNNCQYIAERATKQKFLVKEDRDMLNEIFHTQDPTFRAFSCSSCGGEIFNLLNQLLVDMNNGTIVEASSTSDVPARIKRSRKKKA
jgi:hypothetical protein